MVDCAIGSAAAPAELVSVTPRSSSRPKTGWSTPALRTCIQSSRGARYSEEKKLRPCGLSIRSRL